jgi:hypothetical protein
LLIERNREDIVYGALRALNQGLTDRLALNQPLAALLVRIVISISVVFLIISIASAISKFNIREMTISNLDQIALRS